MTAKLTASLRAAPATVPALAAVPLFVVWATDQAGYPVTHWGAGGLILLALLLLAIGIIGLRLAEVPVPVRVALGCLAAYAALSYLSILWASAPGEAWEGANRTLLYLVVFALFAAWRQRGESAAVLLVAWTLAMAGVAAFVALHVDAASAARLPALIPDGRLTYPTGYANANAALWLIAAWPAVLLAGSARVPWPLRAVLAGATVLLCGVSLLGQSRGSLYATPIVLVLVFALLPGRARRFAVLAVVAGGLGAAAPALLRVGNDLRGGQVVPAKLHTATLSMFAAAAAVTLVMLAAGALESRLALAPEAQQRVRTAVGALAIATVIALLAGGWVAVGNPASRVRHAWDTFKSPRGYAANATGSRLTSGFGSQRYDFYRVALDEFLAHPLVGIGADNFQQEYLVHGRSQETPRYPHSVELRTLAQTGLLGALLALAGIAAALVAAGGALRSGDMLGRAVAAAALGGFAYWLVHGSFDWFWEFAGLGAPAFALLGLACALAPRSVPLGGGGERDGTGEASEHRAALTLTSPSRGRLALLAAGSAVALAAAASLAAPWLSQLEVQDAARIWTVAPGSAYSRLDEAAGLNPLATEPYLVAGSIALRLGEPGRADREFRLALGRSRADAYATLERGAIASSQGNRATAIALLERAVHLEPREDLARDALRATRAGRRVDVDKLNRLILVKARELR